MQPKELGDLLGVTSNTIRRWCDEFHKYLTPQASPPKGKQRVLAPHDARVLHYVAAARDTGQPIEAVIARLDAMQADDWQGLPETPPEWDRRDETITLPAAASRAYDVAQIAVLQRDLEYTRQALEAATARAESLAAELDAVRSDKGATDARVHALELDLSAARGEVDTLRARLAGYALAGDRPLPLAAIILITALAVAALVIVLLVVVRLVL